MADVAKLAGVSTQTVSRALRDPDAVSDQMRERVDAAVVTTGYVPNLSARGLASNSTRLVALIVPSISTSVFAETLDAATRVLSAESYEIVVGVSDYDLAREEHLVRNLLGRRPDGIIVVGVEHTAACEQMLRGSGLPVVETWEWTPEPLDSLIGYSNHDAMAELLTAMVDRGYRRPVYIGSSHPGDHRSVRRFEGFRSRHREIFGDVEPRHLESDLPLVLASGEVMLGRARTTFADADLLMFGTDVLATGAVLAARRQGLTVPHDVAITGFGDFELAALLDPALTTVSIPAARQGELAAAHLLERMTRSVTARASVDVGFEITLRDSA